MGGSMYGVLTRYKSFWEQQLRQVQKFDVRSECLKEEKQEHFGDTSNSLKPPNYHTDIFLG
eukprot:JP445846.1.p1 GENE.JP445846.1~~JP445846.1.p1  ORF type:complete len:61 (-),score=9.31 JP445846.1:20-202(-)